MATAEKATVYPHIEKTDGVRAGNRAGKPCIVGTRIAVVDVAIAHGQGYTAHEIQSLFSSPPLTLAEHMPRSPTTTTIPRSWRTTSDAPMKPKSRSQL